MESFRELFQNLKHFNLSEIKLMTGDFDKKNLIGEGGFGKVYEGVLVSDSDSDSNGQIMAAFKRLDSNCGQGTTEFLKEIMMFSRYKHENLISFLGFCDEDGEKILVYEHASQGSLDVHLSSISLTWTQRLKICLGAARGLCYLHDPNETQQRVIHRDIKSSNILLDENWNPKISDMGLSIMGSTNLQQSFLAADVVGTFFYVDPMYMETSILTKESDVYSFGVVLFEVLCGRLCFEDKNGHPQSLVRRWKKSYKEKKLEEIIFHDMKQDMHPKSLEAFSEIAYGCLQKSRAERPNMSRVVEELEIALQFQQEISIKEMVKAAVTVEELEMLLSKIVLDNEISRSKELEKMGNTGVDVEDEDMVLSRFFLNKEISTGMEFEEMVNVAVKKREIEILLSNKVFSETELEEMIKDAISKEELELLLAKRFPNKEELELFLSKGILVNGGNTWFSSNKHGEQCEMISPADWRYSASNSDYHYSHRPFFVSSRFSWPGENELCTSFKAHVTTHFLTPGVTYTVNIVFNLENMWGHYRYLQYTFAGETKFSTSFIRNEREDGWLMTDNLCHFICNKENSVLDITFDCRAPVRLEGIEIRSLQRVHHEQVLEEEDVDVDTHPDTYWEQKLPDDWEEMLESSEDSVQWTTNKELYSILCKGFLISSGVKWLYLANNGKKGVMVSAEGALPRFLAKDFDWKSSPGSRFGQVACDPVGTFRMKASVDSLSLETTYAAYLVYKLQENHPRFETPVKVHLNEDDGRSDKCYIYLLSHPPPVIRGKVYQKKRIPQQRNDGWMEVPIWEFHTDQSAFIWVEFELIPSDNMSLKGLIVEGIDFRPI